MRDMGEALRKAREQQEEESRWLAEMAGDSGDSGDALRDAVPQGAAPQGDLLQDAVAFDDLLDISQDSVLPDDALLVAPPADLLSDTSPDGLPVVRPGTLSDSSPDAYISLAASGALATPALLPDSREDLLSERILDSAPAWRGDFLTIDVLECELPDGRRATRDIVRHPGATAIIALDEQGRVLVEHQYRVAAERITREIPAGKLEVGEDPAVCAARELEEETGYRATQLRYLFPFAPALGYSDEIIHLFLATGLQRGECHPDNDEFLAVEWLPLEELVADVLAGRIEDSKTIIGVMLVDKLLRP